MKSFFFVTKNKDKIREAEEILGFQIKKADLLVDEIQAVEVERVIEKKAKQAFEKIKKPVICEDSGLYFESWNGLPGALIKIFEERLGQEKICKMLAEKREAKAKSTIGYFDGNEYRDFVGEISGKIAQFPRGNNGFGWDPIFIPQGFDKTFAQMTKEEKNKISMRKIAFNKFKRFLNKK